MKNTDDKYKKYNSKQNYKKYTAYRDCIVYELWKSGKSLNWIANYVDRSYERVRQIINQAKYEEKVNMQRDLILNVLPALPFPDERRLKKLEEVLSQLTTHEETYFYINKLTSLKSLCRNYETAIRFVYYLSELTLERLSSRVTPSYIEKDEWEKFKLLAYESVKLMSEFIQNRNEENISVLHKQLQKLKDVQNETRHGMYGRTTRTIYCNDLLTIEYSYKCILSANDYSYWTYLTARNYAGKYNSRHGTGLIKESVPMLQDIINFWRKSLYSLKL